MKYLLDTHALIWFFSGNVNLSNYLHRSNYQLINPVSGTHLPDRSIDLRPDNRGTALYIFRLGTQYYRCRAPTNAVKNV